MSQLAHVLTAAEKKRAENRRRVQRMRLAPAPRHAGGMRDEALTGTEVLEIWARTGGMAK